MSSRSGNLDNAAEPIIRDEKVRRATGGRVDGDARRIREPGSEAGGRSATGRHFDDAIVPGIGNIEIAQQVDGDRMGTQQGSAHRNHRLISLGIDFQNPIVSSISDVNIARRIDSRSAWSAQSRGWNSELRACEEDLRARRA
ncbi:MAG TPA: hypothetical protein VHX49_00320 [Candidatus Acidoferrales bacterium]|nr:hypothetical protein [Candidatus Acidoferrales bacterium]